MKFTELIHVKRWSDVTVFNGIGTFTEIADSDSTSADIKGKFNKYLNKRSYWL